MSYLAILQYASDSYVLLKIFSFNDKYLKQFLSSDNIYYYFLLCSIYYLLLFIPFSICFMDFFWFSDDYDDVQPLPEDFPPPPPEIRYQLTPN